MSTSRDILSAGQTDAERVRRAFGTVLATHRTEAGLRQREFSRITGISNSHLRSIEAGNVSPAIVTVFKLAATLDIEPDVLIRETYELAQPQPRTSVEYMPPTPEKPRR